MIRDDVAYCGCDSRWGISSAPCFGVLGRRQGHAGETLRLIVLAAVLLLGRSPVWAEQVRVAHREGLAHGFLALGSLDGKKLADGEMTQVGEGNRIHSRLVFRFYDGSIYDDETELTQDGVFRLVKDHLVIKGPSFKKNSDTLIDVAKGEVTVRYRDDDGKEKVLNQKMELPPDLANGMLMTLVKHIPPTTFETSVSMLAASPKPRIVKLVFSRQAEAPVSNGRRRMKAAFYKMKVDIGGVTGVLAKVAGKLPADTRIWVLQGVAPAFIQWEGPLYDHGPVWRIQMAVPRASANVP